jgi:hypothetical protein
MGQSDNPLCRRCGAEDEISPAFFVGVTVWLHSDMRIWAPSSWSQRTLSLLFLGPFGTLVKQQGSHKSIWGQTARRLRPRCIGAVKYRTQSKINHRTTTIIDHSLLRVVSAGFQTNISEARHKLHSHKLPQLDSYLRSLPSSGTKILYNSNIYRKQ